MEHDDRGVLEHLKLHTEDGDMIDGPEVTKERIEELKKKQQNPTWYAEADWVVRTYGPRADIAEEKEPPEPEAPAEPAAEPSHIAESEMVELLKEQLAKRDEDIAYLREELKTKNEQIDSANARTRESNVLMQELQRMLGSWQDQAFRTLPAARRQESEASLQPASDMPKRTVEKRGVTDSPQTASDTPVPPSEKRDVSSSPREARHPSVRRGVKRGTPSRKPAKSSKSKRQARPKSTTKKDGPAKKESRGLRRPKWYEMPTFSKMIRLSSRRK